VTNGLENVGLDEASKKGRIMAATRRYGELSKVRNSLKRFRAVVVSSSAGTLLDDLLHKSFRNNASRRALGGAIEKPQNELDQTREGTESQHDSSLDLLESDPMFFKQPADNYWDHVTVHSFSKYKELYEDICDRRDGYVSCKYQPSPHKNHETK
jgi:hypothetical protein